jgi:hypothetical protein
VDRSTTSKVCERCLPPLPHQLAGADDVREDLEASGSRAVILAKANRRSPVPFDEVLYKARNWRAIATRYDNKANNFLAGVCLVAAVIYWRH